MNSVTPHSMRQVALGAIHQVALGANQRDPEDSELGSLLLRRGHLYVGEVLLDRTLADALDQ